MMEQPIFCSAHQAVQVAYSMESRAPDLGSSWRLLQRLRGSKTMRPDAPQWGDLSPMERRAECANIRATVEHVLIDAELDVILAKFSRDHNQLAAIMRLREHVAPMIAGKAAKAVGNILVWIYYDRRHRPSLRAIGRHYGISDGTVRSGLEEVGDIVTALEDSAMSKLTELFVRCGIAET
ncbi:MAG: hypothetical protein ABSC19_07095 [Syntrophorhabdales bacterium]|jgi:hypothetical protein